LDLTNPTTPRVVLGSIGQPPLLGATADGAVTSVPLGAVFGGQVGVPFTGAARAAARSGDVYLVATDTRLFLGIPASPTGGGGFGVGSLLLPSGVRSMALAGGTAYLACEDGLLRAVDVRTPAHPRLLDLRPGDATGVTVSGGLLLLSGPTGLEVRKLPVA